MLIYHLRALQGALSRHAAAAQCQAGPGALRPCAQVFNGFQILERFPRRHRRAPPRRATRVASPRGRGHRHRPTAVDLPIFEEAPPAAVDPLHATASACPAEPAPAAAEAPAKRPRAARRRTASLDPRSPCRSIRHRPGAGVALRRGLPRDGAGPRARLRVSRPARAELSLPAATMEFLVRALGCTVPWSAREALLKLEDSSCWRFRASLARSPRRAHPQPRTGRAGVSAPRAHAPRRHGQRRRRVLRPTDFLGRPLAHGEVLAPGMEVALQLRLETPTPQG
jgi:hypothetical protein